METVQPCITPVYFTTLYYTRLFYKDNNKEAVLKGYFRFSILIMIISSSVKIMRLELSVVLVTFIAHNYAQH